MPELQALASLSFTTLILKLLPSQCLRHAPPVLRYAEELLPTAATSRRTRPLAKCILAHPYIFAKRTLATAGSAFPSRDPSSTTSGLIEGMFSTLDIWSLFASVNTAKYSTVTSAKLSSLLFRMETIHRWYRDPAIYRGTLRVDSSQLMISRIGHSL